ncbi:MAG: tRNA (N(6)-L-threonylcarbamoyladenosine(37)-C(2))-methylthiotransferase MtaB [Bacteroidetes bacterium]|nr:tRNA (N(6)-L-threonylcarbamoyladenosine(37)-C(2))-methylthiotransferase MtaB [Bacteroidota bacterium]
MPITVSLHTLGCKLNYSETSSIAKQFTEHGLTITKFGESSDVFVLNTCTVTSNADKECRQLIRRVLRNNPETYVIVTGCYAQLQPEEIAEIEGVDLVLGSNEKFQVFDYIENLEKKNLSCVGSDSKVKVFISPVDKMDDVGEAFSEDIDSRTRAFLKIQDGCDYNCSFCTIPLARGKSRSLAPEKVIENAKKIIDAGYKEIVLTGVNTGDYSYQNLREKNDKTHKLVDILYELDKLNISRIRISSIEPNLLSDGIISITKSSDKLCNHFHIPLQSGDPEILKLMKRRYSRELFEELVYKLNEEIKDVGVGVDVIIGSPGETESHFRNTFEFLESLPISYLHVFNYSERRNTRAITLSGKVGVSERKERSLILRNLSARKKFDFYSKFIGSEQEVLFEKLKEDSKGNLIIEGFTTNYIRVTTKRISNIENSIKHAKLLKTNGVKPIDCKIVGEYSEKEKHKESLIDQLH